jgi:hypothetical protein
MGDFAKSQPQILQQSIVEVVNQPMNPQLLSVFPGLLHDGNPRDIVHLFSNVELTKQILIIFLVRAVKLVPVLGSCFSNMRKPGLERPVVVLLEGRTDSSAPVVAGDDDVLHLQHLHGVLQNSEEVDIRGRSLVGHVPVHEKLSWLQPHDLVGGHSRVGAANPEVLGGLDADQSLEVFVILCDHGLSPLPVVLHDLLEVVHLGRLPPEGHQLVPL